MPTDTLQTTAGVQVNLVGFQNHALGTVAPARRYLVKNTLPASAGMMTMVRVYVKLVNGRFKPQTGPGAPDPNLQGLEMMADKWVEVRSLGLNTPVNTPDVPEGVTPFKPIGGPYGLNDNGTEEGPDNYLALPDIPVGQYVLIEVRPRIPASPETERIASVRFGVSFRRENLD